MKKWISLLLCMACVLALTGCGGNHKSSAGSGAGVKDVIEQGMAEADSKSAGAPGRTPENVTQSRKSTEEQDTVASETASEAASETASEPSAETASEAAEPAPASLPEAGTDGIDVDLTVLSSTMVYSEVYNMMAYPEDYIGKTVKMKGAFAHFHDEAANTDYFACIIQDATACCAQGIEFVLTDEYVYPDDYPALNEEICVAGVFDTYEEGSFTYCTLRNAKLV